MAKLQIPIVHNKETHQILKIDFSDTSAGCYSEDNRFFHFKSKRSRSRMKTLFHCGYFVMN